MSLKMTFHHKRTIRAIVTVKLKPNPNHDPRHKKTGPCPLFYPKDIVLCSDVTGSHHSYIEEGITLSEIWDKAAVKYGHVTRVEILPDSR